MLNVKTVPIKLSARFDLFMPWCRRTKRIIVNCSNI